MNKKHGNGTQIFEGGLIFKGKWKNDVPAVGIWSENGMKFYGASNIKEKWRIGNSYNEDGTLSEVSNGFFYKNLYTGLG